MNTLDQPGLDPGKIALEVTQTHDCKRVDKKEDDDPRECQEPVTGDMWIKKRMEDKTGETVKVLELQLCTQRGTIGYKVIRQVAGPV